MPKPCKIDGILTSHPSGLCEFCLAEQGILYTEEIKQKAPKPPTELQIKYFHAFAKYKNFSDVGRFFGVTGTSVKDVICRLKKNHPPLYVRGKGTWAITDYGKEFLQDHDTNIGEFNPPFKSWLNLFEVSALYGVEKETVRRWCVRDGLPHKKTSAGYLIKADDVKQFLEEDLTIDLLARILHRTEKETQKLIDSGRITHKRKSAYNKELYHEYFN